jgi:hypothetical protein
MPLALILFLSETVLRFRNLTKVTPGRFRKVQPVAASRTIWPDLPCSVPFGVVNAFFT